jgi:hypothetical protein
MLGWNDQLNLFSRLATFSPTYSGYDSHWSITILLNPTTLSRVFLSRSRVCSLSYSSKHILLLHKSSSLSLRV